MSGIKRTKPYVFAGCVRQSDSLGCTTIDGSSDSQVMQSSSSLSLCPGAGIWQKPKYRAG